MNFVKNKSNHLSIAITSFLTFLIFSIAGIMTIERREAVMETAEGATFYWVYSNIYSSAAIYIVPITIFLFLILLIVTLLAYNSKLKSIVTYKAVGTICYSAILALLILEAIDLNTLYQLNLIGNVVDIMLFVTMALVLLGLILVLIYSFSPSTYVSMKPRKNEGKKRDKEREYAVKRLRNLKMLLDGGAINQEEFDKLKQKYINLL